MPLAEFVFNSWRNESTKKSPFELLMGYNPKAEWSIVSSPVPQVTHRLEQIQEARDQARLAMRKAQLGWIKDSKRKQHVYHVGDQVWLDGRNIKMYHSTAKLAAKRHGPFPIQRVLSPIDYQLTLPEQWKIHNMFHVDLLTPYRETEFHGPNYARLPPDLVGGEEQYEVEQVLDDHNYGCWKKKQYLVKWKGYPNSDNQWLDAKDMDNAQELIAEFHNSHSNLSSHIKRLLNASPIAIPLPLYHLYSSLPTCPMPPHSQNSLSEPKKIQIHSPFLHAQLPQMHPLINYAYRTPRQPASSASETAISHTLTSPLPVSSTTQTKKTYRPPYQKFHVVVPLFAYHSEEPKRPSPSQTTLPPTKQYSPPSPKCAIPSTTVTRTSARSKRSSASLAPSDMEGRPAKMTKLQHSSHNCTRFDDWNLDLSRLPLRHMHPLTSPFRHLLFRETRKSQRVPRPPVPESAQWPADCLRPSNVIPEVPEVQGLKRAAWEEEYSLFRWGFASELSCCLLARQEELRRRLP